MSKTDPTFERAGVENMIEDFRRLVRRMQCWEDNGRRKMKDSQIAGAMFDFIGFLTTRSEPITLSRNHLAPPAVEALREWARERGLDLDEADVKGWREA